MTTKTTTIPSPQCVDNLIAVVGCDGTGKSTLTHDLVARLNRQRPTEWRYLGLVSGETGDKIKKLPLIGVWLERRLAKKTEKEQSRRNTAPMAWWVVLTMYAFSLWRRYSLKRICELANNGKLVVVDRFPQAEITGFHYDGPGIGSNRVKAKWARWLAERENRLYQQQANIHPALIIRLDIDIETAWARKPDHSRQELEDKIRVMSQLDFNGSRILDLDARAPYEEVIEKAYQAAREVAAPDSNANKVCSRGGRIEQ